MKRNTYFHSLAFLFILILLNACASYEPQPLPDLQPEFAAYSENIEDVTLACRALSKKECEKYFDRDIIGNGYQPVLITIVNDSDKEILFSPEGLSVPVCSPEEVAEKCHTSTAGRATAYGVGALFLWPLAVPAIVDGVKSYQANEQLDQDFGDKFLDERVIEPNSTHNGIVFISNAEYQESFTVKLLDRETKQDIVYQVNGLEGHFTPEDIAPDESNKKETEDW